MALIMDFAKAIAQSVSELAVWLEETHDIDRTQVSQKWRELTGMKLVIQDEEDTVGTVRRSASVSSTASSKATCKHVFMVGEKKGQQCTTKPKNGAEYCSAHKSHKPKDSDKSHKSHKSKDAEKVNETNDEAAEKPKKKSSTTKSKKEDSTKKSKKAAKKEEELPPLSEEEEKEELLPSEEEEIPKLVEPLLKKTSKKTKKTVYDTDEEIIDNDYIDMLNLRIRQAL